MDNLNKRAKDAFDIIKERQGWTFKSIEEAAKKDDSIDVEKIQKMMNAPPVRVKADDFVKHYDAKISSAEVNPLAFIDALGLPPNLSIAIAAIIEYGNKGKKSSLVSAAEYIEKELRDAS